MGLVITLQKCVQKSKQGSTTGKVHCMDDEAETSEQSSDEESNLYMIESVSALEQTNGEKWFVTL